MNCQETRSHFALFYDSEGGAEFQHQISEHLASCPECRHWYTERSSSEDVLLDLLNRGESDAELWKRIEDRVVEAERNSAVSTARIPKSPLLLLVAGATAVAAALLAWIAWPPGTEGDLAELAAIEHANYVGGEWKAEIVSNSVFEVEQKLRPLAGFPVRCPPDGQAGFRLKGGGVCAFSRHRSVHIVGEVDQLPVSIFVLPPECIPEFTFSGHPLAAVSNVYETHAGNYRIVASLAHDHLVIALGETDCDTLLRILRGYGEHETQRVVGRQTAMLFQLHD